MATDAKWNMIVEFLEESDVALVRYEMVNDICSFPTGIAFIVDFEKAFAIQLPIASVEFVDSLAPIERLIELLAMPGPKVTLPH